MLNSLFPHYRLTIAVTLLFTALGIVGFYSIPKEEDPHLKNRWGLVAVVFPGAETERIEEWVVNPIENELRSTAEIKKIESVIRPQYAAVTIELNDNINEIEDAWNEIQRKIDLLRPKLPSEVTELTLDRRVIDLEAILISLESSDIDLLSAEGLKLRRSLLKVSQTKEVILHGDPEMGISVKTQTKNLTSRGLTMPLLFEQLQRSNLSVPSGVYQQAKENMLIKTPSSLNSVDEVRRLPILFPSLSARPLGQIADVSWSPAPFPQEIVRVNGKRALVLGIVPNHPVDVIEWGARVRVFLSSYQLDSRIKLQELSYQPKRTLDRIRELAKSLLIGMISVVTILGLWMGWRLGLVVAISVPVISVIGFGFYYLGGGVLHQISLAALLLSLGQFIDNVTVVAESVQRKVDGGMDTARASAEASKQFRLPMIFATGTAIASFIPMLASQGATAEFTIAIPLISIITLLVSWFFALQVTPVLTALLLRPSLKKNYPIRPKWFHRITDRILNRPRTIILVTLILLVLSIVGLWIVKKDFFPGADRNEFILTLEMPKGSSLLETDRFTRKIESILLKDNRVKLFSSYVGRTTPIFFYSILPDRRISDLAEIFVTTKDSRENLKVASDTIRAMRSILPKGALLISRQLMQGPPVKAAIELEVRGDDLQKMNQVIQKVIEEAKAIPGVEGLRSDAPRFLPILSLEPQEERFLENGSDRNQLALTLLAWSQGVDATHFYKNGDRFPIRLLADDVSAKDLSILPTLNKDYRIGEVTAQTPGVSATSINHVGGERAVRLLSNVSPGYGINEVAPKLVALLEAAKLPGWSVVVGGQGQESASANLSILRALPIGLLLLISCLLYEFRSFRKILLVMFGVATASAGIVPGLLLGDQPFGFMSLLGVLALVGIVVNNAILIIEAIEQSRESGQQIDRAIREALELRTRPILMTTLMTLLGLLPLAFEESTLWPPMAWAMISGLLVSTFLSLFSLPAAYLLLFKSEGKKSNRVGNFATMSVLVLFFSGAGEARIYSMDEIESALRFSPTEEIRELRQSAAQKKAQTLKKEVFYPKLRSQFDRTINDRDLFISNSFSRSPYGRNAYWVGGVELEQPVFLPSRMLFAEPAAQDSARAERLRLERKAHEENLQAIKLAISLQELSQHLELLVELQTNLRDQGKEARRLISRGRAAPSDALKVEVELETLNRQMELMKDDQIHILELLRIRLPDLQSIKNERPASLAEKLKKERNDFKAAERADLQAFEKEIKAYDGLRKAELAAGLPELRVFGRYQHTDQGFLDQNDWYTIGLQLRWEIWDGGARYERASASVKERYALEKEKKLLSDHIQTEQRFIQNQIKRLHDDIVIYDRTAQKTKDILKKEREAYRRGKVTLNQVLDSERIWINQRRNLITSLYSLWRFKFEERHAHGEIRQKSEIE
jgi:multidrug efflux pump subunit AcrB/outer membrane protein TolC